MRKLTEQIASFFESIWTFFTGLCLFAWILCSRSGRAEAREEEEDNFENWKSFWEHTTPATATTNPNQER